VNGSHGYVGQSRQSIHERHVPHDERPTQSYQSPRRINDTNVYDTNRSSRPRSSNFTETPQRDANGQTCRGRT
jgi:hypothetical protein